MSLHSYDFVLGTFSTKMYFFYVDNTENTSCFATRRSWSNGKNLMLVTWG